MPSAAADAREMPTTRPGDQPSPPVPHARLLLIEPSGSPFLERIANAARKMDLQVTRVDSTEQPPAEGTVVGENAVPPGHFADHQPPALLMLHPPSETNPSLPECAGAASGCVLLPGLPHLGLEHRAAWVEAESDGTVTSMVSRVGIDPISDPDTAILAMLLAA